MENVATPHIRNYKKIAAITATAIALALLAIPAMHSIKRRNSELAIGELVESCEGKLFTDYGEGIWIIDFEGVKVPDHVANRLAQEIEDIPHWKHRPYIEIYVAGAEISEMSMNTLDSAPSCHLEGRAEANTGSQIP